MKQTMKIRGGLLAGAALCLSALLVAPVSAQDTDSRWLPWYGCWVAQGNDEIEADPPMVCVRPSDDGAGVTIVTAMDGEVISQSTRRADGVPVEFEQEGCIGTERAEFSEDSRRIFLETSLTCEGGTTSTSTGIIAMVSPYTWIDVKAIDVDGELVPFLMQYRAASTIETGSIEFPDVTSERRMALETARVTAARKLDIDDVIEASARVEDVVIEAWVAESGSEFSLDAQTLVELADSGVSGAVTDIMIAMSFPDEFAVGQPGVEADVNADRVAAGPLRYSGSAWYYGYASPFAYSPYYSRYYGGWGYGPGYGYGFYPGYDPIIIVRNTESTFSRVGRVIKGRGYSSGRPSSSSGSSGQRAATRRGSTGSSAAAGSSSTSTRRSSSGRKAKRRGGGGF